MFKKFFNWFINYTNDIADRSPKCAEADDLRKLNKDIQIECGKLQWAKHGIKDGLHGVVSGIGKLVIDLGKYLITCIPILVVIAAVAFVVVKVIF